MESAKVTFTYFMLHRYITYQHKHYNELLALEDLDNDHSCCAVDSNCSLNTDRDMFLMSLLVLHML